MPKEDLMTIFTRGLVISVVSILLLLPMWVIYVVFIAGIAALNPIGGLFLTFMLAILWFIVNMSVLGYVATKVVKRWVR